MMHFLHLGPHIKTGPHTTALGRFNRAVEEKNFGYGATCRRLTSASPAIAGAILIPDEANPDAISLARCSSSSLFWIQKSAASQASLDDQRCPIGEERRAARV